MNQTVSIVVPAFNEAKRLSHSLEEILSYVETGNFTSEVIVVDDGSTDETSTIAKEKIARFKNGRNKVIVYGQNRGKGFAVRTGFLAATGDIVLFSDADLSTPISEMEKIVAPLRSGSADVTFGSRALDRSLIGTHQSWRREQGGKVFNLVVRASTKLPFWDTQCGFKAFRSKICRPMFEAAQIDRFGFDVELLSVAHCAGLRLQEIPVRWNHCEGSKVNVLNDSWRMFKEVREIRRNLRHGIYNRAIEEINLLKKETTPFSLAASA